MIRSRVQALSSPDLSVCDREPIHTPGSVQPDGCLLAFDRALRVVARSQNVADWFGPGEIELGAAAQDRLDDRTIELLRRGASGAPPGPHDTHTSGCALGDAPGRVHRNSQGLLIAEIFRPESTMTAERLRALGVAGTSLMELGAEGDDVELVARQVSGLVRDAIRYDRVMVYRFAADGAGEVVAESRRDDLEPFLGLRYPASDIPTQARELYVRNPVRQVSDVGGPTVQIEVAEEWEGGPIDLGEAALRSVSPVHREYLRNMSVAASMSVSIIVDGRLWGLIACHHELPRSLPIEAWPMVRLLGMVASTRIAEIEHSSRFGGRLRAAEVSQMLLSRLNEAQSLDAVLSAGLLNVRALIRSDGVQISHAGRLYADGAVPQQAHARIVGAMKAAGDTSASPATLVHAEQGLGPGWDTSMPGVLAVGGDDPSDYVAWFRVEQARSVDWAGDPSKIVERVLDGEVRLAPRKSFAKWTEIVRGTCAPWSAEEIAVAGSFGESLRGLAHRDVVLRNAALRDEIERRKRSERELRELTRELEAFAHAASHDLKQPARKVTMRLSMLAEALGDLDPESRRSLDRALADAHDFHRIINAMNTLANSSTTELRMGVVHLRQIVGEVVNECATDLEDAGGEIAAHDLPAVLGDRTLLKRVFANMIENAIKYRHPDRSPRIDISASPADDARRVCLEVRDNGQGIGDDQLPRMFEAFARCSADRSIEGSGLGLTICRRIIQRHGGVVWVDSCAGEGTSVFFTLERAASPPPSGP
ncbi:MAG: ATP-binding protein [Planctomycetota bacterium]